MLTSKEFTGFLFQVYDSLEASKKEQAKVVLTEKLLSLSLPIHEEAIDEWIVLVENGFRNFEQSWRNNFLMEKLERELMDIEDTLLNKKLSKKEKEVLQTREQEILLIIQSNQNEILKKRDAIAINPPKNKIETLANMLHVNFSSQEISGIEAWIGETYNRRAFSAYYC